MDDIILKEKNLPAKVEELSRFIKIGRERHNARLAEIRALESIPEAQEMRDRLIEQTAEELGETWEVHGQLGRLIKQTDLIGRDISINEYSDLESVKGYTLQKYGLDKNDSRIARGILAAIGDNILSDLIDKMKRIKTILRYSALYNEWKKRQPKPETPILPEGFFNVIHADPPWPISKSEWDKWELAIDVHYKPMSLKQIKEVQVQDRAATDCSLFLWTTHTFLEKAFEVIEAWGFKYHCCLTWDKGSGWTLFGFHRRTEFCLYAYRGKINIDPAGKAIPTLIVEKKREHSRKPEEIYRLIESKIAEPRFDMWPGDYNREGWVTWGKEHER